MKKWFSINLGLLFVVLLSCSANDGDKQLAKNGIWESIGFGWILEIKDDNYSLYDINSVACLLNRNESPNELSSSVWIENDTLILKQGVTTYQFIRIKEIPSLCAEPLDIHIANNPILNFEYFAETVREHYAFMDLNNIDWDDIYKVQNAKLNNNSTDAQLYLVIEETLELLNDNHAFLEAPDNVYKEIDLLIDEREDEPFTEGDDLLEYGDFQVAEMVAKNHLQEVMTDDSWLIEWGKMTDDIGFVEVKAMWLFADIQIPKSLKDSIGFVNSFIETRYNIYVGDYIQKEVEGVRKIMNKIMKDLSDSEAIVIDIRFNGGGQDAVSLEILRHFNNTATKAAKHYFKNGASFTAVQHLMVEASENAYSKPVYVLTSSKTGSAAEIFSLATRSMENVKRIGSSTDGALSTTLDKKLPNGWTFSISNEIYTDNNENCYENLGVPVDYELNYPKSIQGFFRSVVNDLDKDKQDILNAIKNLENIKEDR